MLAAASVVSLLLTTVYSNTVKNIVLSTNLSFIIIVIWITQRSMFHYRYVLKTNVDQLISSLSKIKC